MPKVVDHDAYRAELLQRSFDLFAREGYRNVTMRGIARELGVSTGTLYHYFETKDDIFGQMVRQVAVNAVDEALMGVEPGATPLERLDRMFEFVRDHEVYLRNLLFVVIDFHRSQASEDGQRIVRDAIHFFRDAITRHAGSLPPALGGIILSGLLGTLLQRSLDQNEIGFDDQAAYLRQLIAILG
jgi:AcrR family transcriptional regulator